MHAQCLRIVLIFFSLVGPGIAGTASAQVLVDTTFAWRGYTSMSTCRVRLYRSAENVQRPLTVVLDELSTNPGRSTLDDAPLLVELVARTLLVEPDSAYWVFHWGAFSFAGAEPSNRELFLRATFRRTASGRLSTPSLRIVNRSALLEYTDRAFR